MEDNERDAIDRLIDGALASYADREPRPGFEQRLLYRIHASGRRKRVLRWWAAAIPVAACVLGAAVFWPRRAPEPKRPVVATVRPAAPVVEPPIQLPPGAAIQTRRKRVLPRQAQFPAPAPLTREERALLAFVERAPEEAWKALNETKPIRIQEIQIPPLESDDGK